MSRNGNLSVTVKARGMRDRRYQGKWIGNGSTYRMSISERGAGASGTFKLSDRGRSLRWMKFDGRDDDGRFSLDFQGS